MSVWFVTPAWQRYALSAVCFEQRALVMDELEQAGVEARQVVIADDENLDIARGLGFETIEQNNDWLGRRFNDGTEYAAKHGAEWIVPIGSDSWIDPAYFLPLPQRLLTRTSKLYAVVTEDRLASLSVGGTRAGPYMFNRRQLERTKFRPSADKISRNIDHTTIRNVGRVRWEERDLHDLQYIGFRGHPHITTYERLWARWGVTEFDDPWVRLATRYPADLVERARLALR